MVLVVFGYSQILYFFLFRQKRFSIRIPRNWFAKIQLFSTNPTNHDRPRKIFYSFFHVFWKICQFICLTLPLLVRPDRLISCITRTWTVMRFQSHNTCSTRNTINIPHHFCPTEANIPQDLWVYWNLSYRYTNEVVQC